MFDLIDFALTVRRLATVNHWHPEAIRQLQARRWRRLLQYGRLHSPFYHRRLCGVNLDTCQPGDIEPLTKSEMMANFDDLVTDRRITRADVESFMRKSANLARPYHGRYGVCHTSGSVGQPALVVQPRRAMWSGMVVQAARGQRLPDLADGPPSLLRIPGSLFSRLFRPTRLAVVTQKPGFYPSGAVFAYLAAAHLPILRLLRLSVFEPDDDLVCRLNDFQPDYLMGYTSSLEMLAREQLDGRLRLGKQLKGLTNTSEPLPSTSRITIENAFGVHISDAYMMAECFAVTYGCPVGAGSHINSDLAMVEVVDDAYRPVPDGTPGTRILVSNLTNFVQPFIRYEIDDVVTIDPGPCPCGSPFPRIQSVAGRTKERLWIQRDGQYRELPYYLFLAGLHHCTDIADHQVVQTGLNRFVVRVAAQHGKVVSPAEVLHWVNESVQAEGMGGQVEVTVEVVPEIPPEPGSGKKPRVRNLISSSQTPSHRSVGSEAVPQHI